jgi:hypothetical protein
MSPVPANPLWQNFSSMFREAITAQEVGTGMEKSHHLTAGNPIAEAVLPSIWFQAVGIYWSRQRVSRSDSSRSNTVYA